MRDMFLRALRLSFCYISRFVAYLVYIIADIVHRSHESLIRCHNQASGCKEVNLCYIIDLESTASSDIKGFTYDLRLKKS